MGNILINSLKFTKTTMLGIFTDPTFLSDIYIHTLILFTFLTCLFAFYIIKLSTDGFKSHIGDILDNLKPKIEKLNVNTFFQNSNIDISLKEFINSPGVKTSLIDINLKNIIDKTDVEDKFVKQNNKNINNSLVLINVLLWVFIISIVLLYNGLIRSHKECSVYDKINWVEEIIQNTIIFSVIGAIEFIFLMTIIIKFIPVEPSFITKYSLERIKNKFYVPETTN
jgi:hypothetical protein